MIGAKGVIENIFDPAVSIGNRLQLIGSVHFLPQPRLHLAPLARQPDRSVIG